MVELTLPTLRQDGYESEGTGTETDAKVVARQAVEYDNLVATIEKEVVENLEKKHLLRFWFDYNKPENSRRERLRIEITPGAHIATIGILGPPHKSYSIYMPNEILERDPIEILTFIIDKYKKRQWWRY